MPRSLHRCLPGSQRRPDQPLSSSTGCESRRGQGPFDQRPLASGWHQESRGLTWAFSISSRFTCKWKQKQRAGERTRTADLISLRVLSQAFQRFAQACKTRIYRPISFLCLAAYCTVLRSRWCQSGIKSVRVCISTSDSLVLILRPSSQGTQRHYRHTRHNLLPYCRKHLQQAVEFSVLRTVAERGRAV